LLHLQAGEKKEDIEKDKKEGRGLFKGTVHPKMKPLIIYCSKLV